MKPKHFLKIHCKLFVLFALISLSIQVSRSAILDLEPSNQKIHVDEQAQKAYQKGLDYLIQNRLQEAEIAFKAASQFPTVSAHSGLGLVEIAYRRKQLEIANKLLNELQQKYPDNAAVLSSKGRLLYSQGNHQEAANLMQKAITLEPGNYRYHLNIADIYINALQNYQEAFTSYNKAILINPKHAGAHFGAGLAQIQLKKMNTGLALMEKSATLDPKNPIPLLTIAEIKIQTQEFQSALDTLNQLLTNSPLDPTALTLRAKVHLIQNNAELTLLDLEKITAIDTTIHGEIQLLAAQALQALKRYEESQEKYQVLLQKNPNDALVLNNLAWLLYESGGSKQRAQAFAKKAVHIDPSNKSFENTLTTINKALQK